MKKMVLELDGVNGAKEKQRVFNAAFCNQGVTDMSWEEGNKLIVKGTDFDPVNIVKKLRKWNARIASLDIEKEPGPTGTPTPTPTTTTKIICPSPITPSSHCHLCTLRVNHDFCIVCYPPPLNVPHCPVYCCEDERDAFCVIL